MIFLGFGVHMRDRECLAPVRREYLEGHGDLVCRVMMGIIWARIGAINLLDKCP